MKQHDAKWPLCEKCGLNEWEHEKADHKMRWPDLTPAEVRALNQLFPSMKGEPR